MRESAAEVEDLQRLLDASDARAGDHLRSIFSAKERISAPDLITKLDGIFEVHLATLTASGAPLVAPIDAMLLHGRIFVGVPATAVRARLLRRDPRVSASYTDGSFAIITHGVGVEIEGGSDAALEALEVTRELYVAMYGQGWLKWSEERQRQNGRDWSGFIEPRVMFAKR